MCIADMVMAEMNTNAVTGIISFSDATPELTVSTPASDRLLAGTPEQKTRNFFSDPTGQFFAGTWESTPGKWRVRYAESEFCHILRGEVHIEGEAGPGRTFRAGDSFVVPAGFQGTWHVRKPTLKLYAIFEVASK